MPDVGIPLRKLGFLSVCSLPHYNNGFNQEFKNCLAGDEFRW